MCLDSSDWLGVAKVSELKRIPSYGDVIQLTTRVSSPENCRSYSRFRVIKVRVIETNLYTIGPALLACISFTWRSERNSSKPVNFHTQIVHSFVYFGSQEASITKLLPGSLRESGHVLSTPELFGPERLFYARKQSAHVHVRFFVLISFMLDMV